MARTTIQGSFLGDGTVTGVKIGADFISAQTVLSSGLATADELIVSDAGVIKKIAMSVWAAATITLTNKSIDLDANTLTGTIAEFNTALQSESFATLGGTETLAAKTLTTPTIVSTGWTNATHAHAADNSGATLSASILGAGTLPAARIAADSIVEGKFNVSNGPTNGYVLTARDGVAGGFTWEAASAGATLSGSANDTIVTVTGANAMIGEANLTFDGTHLSIAAQGKIFFDGGSNTYIQELTANNMAFYADGGKQLTIGAGLIMNSDISAQNISFQGSTGFTGDTKVTSGNLVIGTAGKGIDFSINTDAGAASGITTDSELLDYYEEGTFTPLVDQGWPHTSNGMAHSTQFGHYTKIGNRVHINLRVITTGFGDCGTGSAGMAVRGLPFVCDSTGNSETGIMLAYSASMSGTVAHTITGVTDANGNAKIYIRQSQTDGSGVSASVTRDELSATCTMNFSGMYEVD